MIDLATLRSRAEELERDTQPVIVEKRELLDLIECVDEARNPTERRPKEAKMTQEDARAVALKVLAELAENAQDESIRLGAATQLAVTTKV